MSHLLIQNMKNQTLPMDGATTEEHAWVFMGKKQVPLGTSTAHGTSARIYGLMEPAFFSQK